MPKRNSGTAQQYYFAHLWTVTGRCKLWPYDLADYYGRVNIDGRRYRVHILACEAWHGPRPPGAQAAHGPCHNPRCFNGAHLSWKTCAENMADKVRDGTSNQGEAQWGAKLTEADVLAIRRIYAAGGTLQTAIGERYGIHRAYVSMIVLRKTWAHI